MKRAVVLGSAGQDGFFLTQQLRERGYGVVGVDVSQVTATEPSEALPAELDLCDRAAVSRFIAALEEVELLFFLAAFHHSSEETHETDVAELLKKSFALHVDSWVNVLDGLARHAPRCRSFYAASSHVFGNPVQAVQDEDTPFRPTNAYGITKAAGVEVTRYFRNRGQHTSAGILYNHESERRQAKFVSQRIAHGAAQAARAVKVGESYALELGALSAVVDWGYAPDYTRAMLDIVDHDIADDYVIASGQPHTVADFCAAAFGALGLDWRDFVVERPGRVTKQLAPLVGNATKLRGLGWAPRVTFEEMVRAMVIAARCVIG
jgi:GDPmannose 4,6-dehydratase